MSSFIDKLQECYSSEETEEDQESLADDEFSASEEEAISADPYSKHDDLSYLRYNRVKQSRSTHLSEKDAAKIREKLAKIKAKNELKKKKSIVLAKPAFKDLEIKEDLRATDLTSDHCGVVFIGPSQAGKSSICGHILHQMALVKKVEIQRAQAIGKESWFHLLMDITEDERRSGRSVELAKASI